MHLTSNDASILMMPHIGEPSGVCREARPLPAHAESEQRQKIEDLVNFTQRAHCFFGLVWVSWVCASVHLPA